MDRTRRVLIVDDDEMMTESLAEICSLNGYETLTANSAEEALGLLRKETIYIVVSDIKMGGMNGIDLLNKIKKMRPDMSAILMTGYTHDDLVIRAEKDGACKILFKPLDPEGFLSLLESLVAS